ncbi:MAG: hypothetical protein WAV11_03290 [Minisyncoccia bacterium]
MVKISKKQKGEIKPYLANLGLILAVYNKLLQTHKNIINDFDKKYRFLSSKKMRKEKPYIWTPDGNIIIDTKFLNKLDDKSRKDLLFIKDEMTKDFKEKILPLVNLPLHFLPYYWNYILYRDIDAPKKNFSINFHPIDPKYDLIKKMDRGTQYITLNIYKPLSTNEKKKALSLVESMGKKAFPKYIKDKLKFVNDITRDLRLYNDASERKRSKTTIEYTDYLKFLKKEVEKGRCSETSFKHTVSLNPHDIDIKKEKSITSKEIGKKFNLKEANVKKIIERYNKKMSLYIN